MSSQYAGANVFPSDFTIPDDGEAENAASVNVALEALGDRTKFLKSNRVKKTVAVYTADGTFVSGANVILVLAIGCGGGGGGGGGYHQSGLSTTLAGSGGGGGGAAIERCIPWVPDPSTSYNVILGLGGAGGAVSAPGSDGSDSVVNDGADTMILFSGAQGGQGPVNCDTSLTDAVAFGGACTRESPRVSTFSCAARVDSIPPVQADGAGGLGVWSTLGGALGFARGGRAPIGRAFGTIGSTVTPEPGNAGVLGTNATHHGGGAGGGGAAGAYGNGGSGGTGGSGNDSGAGHDGSDGIDADPNSGGGGGGGGACGFGSASNGAAGVGGAGADGQVMLIVFEYGVV